MVIPEDNWWGFLFVGLLLLHSAGCILIQSVEYVRVCLQNLKCGAGLLLLLFSQ